MHRRRCPLFCQMCCKLGQQSTTPAVQLGCRSALESPERTGCLGAGVLPHTSTVYCFGKHLFTFPHVLPHTFTPPTRVLCDVATGLDADRYGSLVHRHSSRTFRCSSCLRGQWQRRRRCESCACAPWSIAGYYHHIRENGLPPVVTRMLHARMCLMMALREMKSCVPTFPPRNFPILSILFPE